MTFLANANVSKKIGAAFTIIVGVVTITCASAFGSLISIKSAISANQNSVAEVNMAKAVLETRVERQNAVRGYVASGDPSFVKKIDEYGAASRAQITQWRQVAPEDVADIAAVADEIGKVENEESGLVSAGFPAAETRPRPWPTCSARAA